MLLDGDPALGLGWRLGLGNIVEAATGTPAAYVAPDGSAHRLYNKRFFGGSVDGFFYTRDGSYLRVQYINATSGYKMWTPDGNLTTFGQNVKGYDDPANYVSDYGRGRDGWHATRIENPYADAITVSYQASGTSSACGPPIQNCWVPNQIIIPSINGTGSRTITVNMSGSHIANIQLPTFGSNSTYTFTHHQGGSINRPFPHPPTNPSPWYLDRIDLPVSGYSYFFYYFNFSTTPAYANGAMQKQVIPTGAQAVYTYGTWTWYHGNPLNLPVNCGAITPYPSGRPILKTGPNSEPILSSPIDCSSPDRAAGVVQRDLTYSTLTGGNAISTTEFFQFDYPNGESGSLTQAQSQTLVLSPTDDAANQHSTTYLFSVSTDKAISGPLVGTLLRTAIYAGDQSSSIPDTSGALRVQRMTYETDASDPNPTVDYFEANARVKQSVTIFSGIASTSPPSGKYHQIDYVLDPNAGQYTKETHSGTVGGSTSDAREIETVWNPLIDSTHWKLDKPTTLYLRATSGGANFSTVANSFDAQGFVTSTTTTDGAGGYGTLLHSTPRDSHGFPSSETFTHGSSTYTRTLSFASGTLKTAQWSGIGWSAVNNSQVDSSTGLVSMSTDPAGLSTNFTYDALGRPLATTPPGGDAITTVSYPANPLPTQITSRTADSSKEYAFTQTTTDTLGRPLKVQHNMPGGAVSKKITKYDRQGHATFESEWVADSANDATVPGTLFTSFDHFGRPKTITRADNKTTTVDYSDSFSYPNSVWFKTVTVAGVGGGNTVTKYTSDAFGNLVRVTETPDGGSTNWDTTYTYNPQDRLISVNQGSGTQARTYTYDAFGFLRKENFPEKLNQDVTYSSYDAMGNVLIETQPGSLTITRTYDGAGRLTTASANSVSYLTNCYDGNGPCPGSQNHSGPNALGKLTHQVGANPNPAVTPTVNISDDFEYGDPTGRLSLRTTSLSNAAIASQTQSWIYDPAGEIVNHLHPRSSGLFTVGTAYDHGFPTGVWADGVPVVVSATYQPSGLLASYVTGNNTGHNVTTTIGPDPNSIARPASFTTSGASQNFSSGTYSYDGVGNITAIGSDTFGYDCMSRLTSANYLSLAQSQGFSYDRYGSLTGTTGTNPRSYSVDTRYNRLTMSGTDAVSYDARGNLLQIGSSNPPKEKYLWDALDRTTEYTTNAGADWKYLYDAASERLLKIPASNATSDYVWAFRDEANRIATEYVGPILSRDNVYFDNLLVGSYSSCSQNGPPGWTYYSSDHLGSPRLITDASGNRVDARQYWPYGDEASALQTTSAQRLRFASMERDAEANRYNVHMRGQDFQLLGRFLSTDLIGGHAAVPQSWNLYSYVLGNPLNIVDPIGLLPCGGWESAGNQVTGKLCESALPRNGLGGLAIFSGEFIGGEPVTEGDLTSVGVFSNSGATAFYGTAAAQASTHVGAWESLIPIWGSGRQAYYDFSEGRYVWGTVNTALAASDVFLVRSLTTALGKGIFKVGGSHSWPAVSKWLTKRGWREFPGQEMHHWLFHQNEGLGRYVPDAIKNEPWNLMPMPSRMFHLGLHGKGLGAMSGLEAMWYGTPGWARAAVFSAGGRVLEYFDQ
jgi:RHS repeat-associated protein